MVKKLREKYYILLNLGGRFENRTQAKFSITEVNQVSIKRELNKEYNKINAYTWKFNFKPQKQIKLTAIMIKVLNSQI